MVEKLFWIPNARYTRGFLAAGSHRAVGWQIPQPWVTDDTGARVRLDDVLGGQWSIPRDDVSHPFFGVVGSVAGFVSEAMPGEIEQETIVCC